MRGSQLARVLAEIIIQKPELDTGLKLHLSKWVKSALMKGATLATMREISGVAGPEFISWYLEQQVGKDLVSLTKKFDPHLPDCKDRSPAFLLAHLNRLCAGEIEPSAKPERVGNAGRARTKTKPVEEIFALRNSQQRRMELEKLTPNQLKAAIKKHDLGVSGLSGKPTKIEMIEHIQAMLASGWPSTGTALDQSKY
jgi:hypothetical protein